MTGSGLRLWFSTASYEAFRWALTEFYLSQPNQQSSENVVQKKIYDKSGNNNVEDSIIKTDLTQAEDRLS